MNRLQAIELFLEAVREGSFSAAGRRFGLAPSSVSRHIAHLEASLRTQLLNRTTRSLTLTEAGQLYHGQVRGILQSLRDAEAAATALQATPAGTLRVHSRTMFGLRVVAPLVPRFQVENPALKVELILSERAARLGEEDFDIDLRLSRPQEQHLMQRRLLESERILVASPAYLSRTPEPRAPGDLIHHRCLTYWMGPEEIVWRFLVEGRLEEVMVPSPFTTNNGEVLRALALQGDGVALLDDYTVRRDLAEGRLIRLLPALRATNTTFDLGIYAVFRQTPYTPVKIQVFLDFMARAMPGVL